MPDPFLDDMVRLLDERGCRQLIAQHLGVAGDGVSVRRLGGGVSNIVFRVDDGSVGVVVKQSLDRLRVAADWHAPQERVLTEYAALTLTHGLTPDQVPTPLFVDPARFAIGLQAAPEAWRDWKTALLAGHIDVEVAAVLGTQLASWHNGTFGGVGLGPEFRDPEAFELLRVDPYYRTAARQLPDLSKPIETLIERMADTQVCLVHGDFSPKNVLVGPEAGQCWVIDFEVAHLGDPAFDLAFLLSHLSMKAVHRPSSAADYDAAARAFVEGYQQAVDAELRPDWSYVLGHTGALLLARVHGKSPAEYLDEPQRRQVHALGESLLTRPATDPDQLATRRDAAARA
ncbi:MAG: phosphotransferase family protein [Jatrophihabitans sp.]